MIQLFVENKLLDVSSEFSTLLTFAIDDLKDFAARNSSYSKVIIMPGTARNNVTLGNIFAVSQSNPYDPEQRNITTNFNAAKKADAIIFQDNIQVFKGTFRLLKIIDDGGRLEYEAAVFGELGGLVASLGAGKIEDLDFSQYNHIFNETNVSNTWISRSRYPGYGYYYPLIDYAGTSTNKHDWDITAFRPCLFAKEYIDKIFFGAGYRYICPLFNTNRFRRLVITSTRKESSATYVSTSFNGTFFETTYFGETNQRLIIGDNPAANFFTLSGGNTLTWNQGTGFTTSHTVIVPLLFDFSNAAVPPTEDVPITLELIKNGIVLDTVTDTISFTSSQYSATYPLSATTATTNGDQFYIRLTIEGGSRFDGVFLVAGSSWAITNTPAFLFASAYGALVQINNTIPRNILQVDFLSSIAKLFNLLIYEDPNQSKLLRIDPWVNFYDLGGGVSLLKHNETDIILINDSGDGILLDNGDVNAVDWSYKLNRNRPIQIIPMSEVNARFYEFAYKQDSDYWNEEYQKRYNETYGNRRYDTQFDFSKDVERAELIFASTPLVQYDGDDKVMPAIYKGEPGDEKPFEGSIRILQLKQIACDSWNIKNGDDVLGSYNTYGYAGHFDDPGAPGADLNFGATQELFYPGGSTGNNQFNLYWSQYMAEITDKDSRLIMAYFRLDEQDIAELDFSKFIWIDGNLFRLHKIVDWNATRPDECMVELLKVVQTVR